MLAGYHDISPMTFPNSYDRFKFLLHNSYSNYQKKGAHNHLYVSFLVGKSSTIHKHSAATKQSQLVCMDCAPFTQQGDVPSALSVQIFR